VERHTAVPCREDLQRLTQILGSAVEEHVAQAPANNDTDDRGKDNIDLLIICDADLP